MQTIWGRVEAVMEGKGGPSIIVVRTKAAMQYESKVWATVGSQTLIARGTGRVPLADVKVGEVIELTYMRGPDGPDARMVYVYSAERAIR